MARSNPYADNNHTHHQEMTMTDRHTTNTTPATPLPPEREAEIRAAHPGDWYAGPWYSEYVDGQADEPAYYRVVHQESGTTLATLPDWAGPIAAFIADAHDAGPELLDEVERLRNELTIERIWHRQAARLAELLQQERAGLRARVAELEQQAANRKDGPLRELRTALAAEAVCICGHPEQQHFEDVCQTCGCGDYLEPEAAREVIARWRESATRTPVDDLPARLEAALTERYTELGNPFSEMRRQEEGPDGWPASRPVGPHKVAETLRELLRRPSA